jgi:hypothetical protein
MRPAQFPEALTGARHRSRPVNATWHAGPCRALAAQFDGLTDPEALAARAEALLSGEHWVSTLLAPLIDALAADMWFEPGLRTSHDALRTGAVLLESEAVSIAATVTRSATLNAAATPTTLVIPGRLTLTRYVRGGDARMRRWRTDPATPDFTAAAAPPCVERTPLTLHDGMVLRHDGRTDGHLIVAADRDIVALAITIKPGAAPLMREYAVADGSFVRAACADEAASRMEMLLTFLRAAGRSDAAPRFDTATRHPAFHLRWAAMREWLMLDARSARPRLAELARGDANQEVRTAATATLAALDRHLEPPCPA